MCVCVYVEKIYILLTGFTKCHDDIVFYIAEGAGFSCTIDQPVVGVLPQPCSMGNRQGL